jgi:hypothetical protein
MATIITKTIGSGRDYPSISAWLAGANTTYPSGLVAADVIWKGVLYPEGGGTNGEWAITSDISITTICDSTRYLWLTAAPGLSFRDNVNKLTNALRYNNANGVAVTTVVNSLGVFNSSSVGNNQKLLITGIQFKGGGSSYFAYWNNGQIILDSCIVQYSNAVAYGCFSAVNCLFYLTTSSILVNQFGLNTACYLRNCNIIGTGSSATAVLVGAYAQNGNIIRNCTFFGFSSIRADTNNKLDTTNSTYNATDLASFGWTGTGNIVSKTAANQFVSLTSGSEDFRLKYNADLVKAGIPDATYTGGLDILGTARNGATPSIGGAEYPRPLITIGDITRSQFSYANNITWVDASANNIYGGSWWDSTGYPNGSSAWATQTVTDTDTVKLVSLDVTTLFQAIYDNPDHLSAVIIGATGSGINQLFAGNTYSDTTKRPKISYDGGADQSITNETGINYGSFGGSANGSEQYVGPDLGTSANWSRWILDVPPPSTRPTSATLKVYTTQQFGDLSIKVFWLRYPPELGPRLTEPSSNTFWTFNQSNNTTLSSISTAWAGDAPTLQVQSSVLRADNLNVYAVKSAYLNLSGSTYATVKTVAIGSGGEYRAFICSSDGTYNNGYYFAVGGTTGQLRRNNSNGIVYTLPNGLNSNFTNTELKIEKVGSTINMYAGPVGTLSFVASYNDPSPISGGFSGFLMAGNGLTTPGITAFDAGLTGSIPVSPTVANILNESLSRGIFRGIFRGIS